MANNGDEGRGQKSQRKITKETLISLLLATVLPPETPSECIVSG